MNDNFQGQLPVKIQRPRWSPVWWVVSGWLKGVGGCQKEKMRVNFLWSVWNSLEDSSMFLKAELARVVQTLNTTSSSTAWHHIRKMNLYTLSTCFVGSFYFFNSLEKNPHCTVDSHASILCWKLWYQKKVPNPIFIKHTIFRWFQVPALTFRHLGPFLTFFLIFLDLYLMVSRNSTWQNPMKPVFAGKV